MKGAEQKIKQILAMADVKVGGNRPGDIIVRDPKLYSKVLSEGSVGLGESYMDGWWECSHLDVFFYKILKAKLHRKVRSIGLLFQYLGAKLLNRQSKSRAYQVGEKHYDAGNDLYKIMLDKRMVYTCAYWKNAKTLDQAQEAKLDLVCKKMQLKPGMKILDIGCGWGSFAKFAAKKYKVKVIGITISKEQVKLAQENCKGLPVEIRLQDYRKVNEKFDGIVSLGMIEHVGYKNYKTYMNVVNKCLKKKGLFVLQTIANHKSRKTGDPWLNKYMFPNGMLPSAQQLTAATEGVFVLEDWHSFGTDYDKTLMAWHKNFNTHWPKIKDNYDERFKRMWNYYMSGLAGAFRARDIDLWQIVFSKGEDPKGYRSVR